MALWATRGDSPFYPSIFTPALTAPFSDLPGAVAKREPLVSVEPHAPEERPLEAQAPGAIQPWAPVPHARQVLGTDAPSAERIEAEAQALSPAQDAFRLANSARNEAPLRFAQGVKGVAHGAHGLRAQEPRALRSVAFRPRGALFGCAVLRVASQIRCAQLSSRAARFQYERFSRFLSYAVFSLLQDAWPNALSGEASWQDASHARFLPRWKALVPFALRQRVLRCAPSPAIPPARSCSGWFAPPSSRVRLFRRAAWRFDSMRPSTPV